MKSADARVAVAPGGLSMAAAPSQAETIYKVSRTGAELICGTTELASALALIGTVGKIHRGKPDGAAIAPPQSLGVPVEFSGVTQDERGPLIRPKMAASLVALSSFSPSVFPALCYCVAAFGSVADATVGA